MNDLALAGALATAPSSAFKELNERPRFWFPLVLLVLTTAGLFYWYYSAVDIEWYKDAILSSSPQFQGMTEEERAGAMAVLTRTTLTWSHLIGVVFGLAIFFAVQALYLLLAAVVTKLPQRFKHWFAFSCWTSLPLLLGTIVAAVLLFLSDNPQINPNVMQALSLNELLFHRPSGSPGAGWLSMLSIPAFLSWVLMVIGVRTWSQRSWAFSAVFILLPVVLIYGTWAVFAFK